MISRFERALRRAAEQLTADACPTSLREAVIGGLFPGGHRFRPSLCYLVASAGRETSAELTDAGAVALELLHAASLIQDDLPAFDNAMERRGMPALHIVHGEALAILAADTLIVGAFQLVSEAALGGLAGQGMAVIAELARATGAANGAVGGQARETDLASRWDECHAAKTGALFAASAAIGAIVSRQPTAPWRAVGACVGRAYQLADDLADATDAPHGNAAIALGPHNAVEMLHALRTEARTLVPDGPRRAHVQGFLDDCVEAMHPMAAR